MKPRTAINKKNILVASLFAVYMAEYMICLICMDRSAYALETSGQMIHYLKMPALAAGFLLFPLSRKFETGIRARRVIMLASNIIFIGGMYFILYPFNNAGIAGYIVSCGISLLTLGFLGGAVYYYFAMCHIDHPYLGRISGTAGAAAFLVQIAVMYVIPAKITMLVLLFAGFAFTAYITIVSRERFEWMFDEPLEYARKGDPSLPNTRFIILGAAAMVMVYFVCSLTDTIIVSMNYAGDMSMYAWPRLFGALGYLVGGYLADIKKRRWVLVCSLCMAILSIPLPFLLRSGNTVVATCHYYVIAVSLIEFMNVFFWELAPKTSSPQLVAGLSRTISCVCATILPLFSDISVIGAISAEVALSIVVLLCITLGGYIPVVCGVHEHDGIKFPSDNDTISANSDLTAKIDEFAKIHGMTPREKDFLIPLIESDDDVQVIASNLNISARTVYRHINSIYEKTGTETRYALIRYFYRMNK